MTDFPPAPPIRPPEPHSAPASNYGLHRAAAVEAPSRALVRVSQPDLMRRAILERSRGRLVIAALGFTAIFGVVAIKLALATVLNPADGRRAAALSRPPAPAAEAPVARATVTDRNGEILAVSLPLTALYANPQQIQNPAQVADRLRTVLPQLDRERVIQRLSGERQFAYIARALTPREMLQVNALGIPGLYFEEAERRYFPQGRTAAHIIGGVDVDGHGIAGVERSFDARLRDNPSEPLRLSFDIRVQLALRDGVQRAITEYNGIGGAGVVIDVNTGEVLSMVSLPDYDANDVGAATMDQRFNRVTVGVYEPGSTFKLLTAAMALENGLQTWQGYDAAHPISVGRFTINDYRGKGRWLALPEILAYSSNLGAARMAAAVGVNQHRDFLRRMGMTARLGIEIPETALPLVPSQRAWRELNTMTIGFGHGISVTPAACRDGRCDAGQWRRAAPADDRRAGPGCRAPGRAHHQRAHLGDDPPADAPGRHRRVGPQCRGRRLFRRRQDRHGAEDRPARRLPAQQAHRRLRRRLPDARAALCRLCHGR